jgi:hypothetical protein
MRAHLLLRGAGHDVDVKEVGEVLVRCRVRARARPRVRVRARARVRVRVRVRVRARVRARFKEVGEVLGNTRLAAVLEVVWFGLGLGQGLGLGSGYMHILYHALPQYWKPFGTVYACG